MAGAASAGFVVVGGVAGGEVEAARAAVAVAVGAFRRLARGRRLGLVPAAAAFVC